MKASALGLVFVCATVACKGPGSDGDTDTVDYGVVINELQAANSVTIQDQSGAFPDWIELFNAGDEIVDLSAFTLTDDPAQPQRWPFPSGTTLEAGAHLIVFADGDPSLVDELHASFSLSRNGETLQLVGPAADDLPVVDSVEFGIQFQDHSWARMPDGGEWAEDDTPTPGGPNG